MRPLILSAQIIMVALLASEAGAQSCSGGIADTTLYGIQVGGAGGAASREFIVQADGGINIPIPGCTPTAQIEPDRASDGQWYSTSIQLISQQQNSPYGIQYRYRVQVVVPPNPLDTFRGSYLFILLDGVHRTSIPIYRVVQDRLAPFELLDPEGRLSVQNIDGAACQLLNSASKVVSGTAADGVSQILLRLRTRNVGEVFTLSIAGGDVMGWLGTVGAPDWSPTLTTTATCSDGYGFFVAYAVYRAPKDYSWIPRQQWGAYRPIQIEGGSVNGGPFQIGVAVVRPPIVFVHGFSSDLSDTWDKFPLYKQSTSGSGYQVFAVDYGQYLSDKGITVNSIDGSALVASPGFRQSHLGVEENWRLVADQTLRFIEKFKSGLNPLQLRLVASQVDFVAHSMGGLLVRYWALQPSYRSARDNASQGYVHKLITIGTPHFGTPQATLLLEPTAFCSRAVLRLGGVYTFKTAGLSAGGRVYSMPGAGGDFSGDGVGSSQNQVLSSIERGYGGIPIAALAGDSRVLEPGIDTSALGWVLRRLCSSNDPIGARATSASFATMFDPTIRPGSQPSGLARRSDGNVPITSALMDPLAQTCALPNCLSAKAHSSGAVRMFSFSIGSDQNHLLDSSSAVSSLVIDLLDTPLSSTQWRLR